MIINIVIKYKADKVNVIDIIYIFNTLIFRTLN